MITGMVVAIYRKDTGEIVMVVRGSETDCLNSTRHFGLDTHAYVEVVADSDLHYIDPVTEERQDRQPFNLLVVGNTIADIPEGTIIRVQETRDRGIMDNSGILELTPTVDSPATVTVELRHPHYLRTEVLVDLS